MTTDFDLILTGAGHAHLGVLRLWAGGRRPQGRVALVSPDPYAWYSGMLPGLLAGRYALEECRIPLQPRCVAAGIDWVPAQVIAMDAETRTLRLAGSASLRGRWLSLNPGARLPALEQTGVAVEVLPVKPFADFIARWQQWQRRPAPLAILGGGAAGVELALAMARQVPALSLFCATHLLAGHPPALRGRALRHLQAAGVQIHENCPVERIRGDALEVAGRPVWRGARLVLASGVSPLPWLAASGLSVDARGFVAVSATLQSLSHPQILAAGDCASLPGTPHSGVYAVRQGPVLAANLAHVLGGEALDSYRPQARALALLADGRGGALLSWAGLTAEGVLCGRWKDFLDRRFMRLHGAAGRT
ncbi:FAD-dependent oxidoreductase [Pseudomonas sp. GCM10022188]|uniref:FAD-dependent oxidoreductase n=1 Tax=Pseudomonas TaxID=286 RepID=UPI001E356E6D|nr:FAD-dependent oxidoreductase [Pseudomonas oryzagri]MCC6073967.1 FAD-dependent oxidoreductase [Pseudomonas oryzagri]